MDLENKEECCSIEKHINDIESKNSEHGHSHDDSTSLKQYYPALISLLLLLSGLTLEHIFKVSYF